MDNNNDPGLSVEIVRLERIPAEQVPPTHHCGFAYTIRVNNQSGKTVQLTGRKWMIKQADGEIETVEGEGVVGEQPVIESGESHTYTSYCLLTGYHGAMWGFYFGKYADDTPALWQIPRFDMGASNNYFRSENE